MIYKRRQLRIPGVLVKLEWLFSLYHHEITANVCQPLGYYTRQALMLSLGNFHFSFLVCSMGCLIVKLHILVKLVLYKLRYHLDAE